MATLLGGPWSPQFPIKFYSGGDQSNQAFGKHIQEIERIYGLLNALDAGKIGASNLTDALNAHVNSVNPHPNLQLDFSKITGDVPAERVKGTLSNAQIPANNITGKLSTNQINGLGQFVQNNTEATITAKSLTENGYVKFAGGFMLVWGLGETIPKGGGEKSYHQDFHTPFPNSCLNIALSHSILSTEDDLGGADLYPIVFSDKIERTGFDFMMEAQRDSLDHCDMRITYIAVGF